MRFKLNSIHYGARVLGLIAGLVIGAPTVLYLAYRGQERLGYPVSGLLVLIRVSVVLGLVSLAICMLLLLIEFAQDRYLDHWYRGHQNESLPLPDGTYECQHCGSQKVRPGDRRCPVCGQTLRQAN